MKLVVLETTLEEAVITWIEKRFQVVQCIFILDCQPFHIHKLTIDFIRKFRYTDVCITYKQYEEGDMISNDRIYPDVNNKYFRDNNDYFNCKGV